MLARKPFRGTVAANVLEHGTGALNIDGCRIEHGKDVDLGQVQRQSADTAGMNGLGNSGFKADHVQPLYSPAGRWPANVILDETTAPLVDQQSGISTSPTSTGRGAGGQHGKYSPIGAQGRVPAPGDTGGASRFFYTAKAPQHERPSVDGTQHPTVKPLDLMRWLVRLVTPPGGLVLDPFAGTGTTAEACIHEHRHCITVEREAEYLPLIVARLHKPMQVGFNFEEG